MILANKNQDYKWQIKIDNFKEYKLVDKIPAPKNQDTFTIDFLKLKRIRHLYLYGENLIHSNGMCKVLRWKLKDVLNCKAYISEFFGLIKFLLLLLCCFKHTKHPIQILICNISVFFNSAIEKDLKEKKIHTFLSSTEKSPWLSIIG